MTPSTKKHPALHAVWCHRPPTRPSPRDRPFLHHFLHPIYCIHNNHHSHIFNMFPAICAHQKKARREVWWLSMECMIMVQQQQDQDHHLQQQQEPRQEQEQEH